MSDAVTHDDASIATMVSGSSPAAPAAAAQWPNPDVLVLEMMAATLWVYYWILVHVVRRQRRTAPMLTFMVALASYIISNDLSRMLSIQRFNYTAMILTCIAITIAFFNSLHPHGTWVTSGYLTGMYLVHRSMVHNPDTERTLGWWLSTCASLAVFTSVRYWWSNTPGTSNGIAIIVTRPWFKIVHQVMMIVPLIMYGITLVTGSFMLGYFAWSARVIWLQWLVTMDEHHGTTPP